MAYDYEFFFDDDLRRVEDNGKEGKLPMRAQKRVMKTEDPPFLAEAAIERTGGPFTWTGRLMPDFRSWVYTIPRITENDVDVPHGQLTGALDLGWIWSADGIDEPMESRFRFVCDREWDFKFRDYASQVLAEQKRMAEKMSASEIADKMIEAMDEYMKYEGDPEMKALKKAVYNKWKQSLDEKIDNARDEDDELSLKQTATGLKNDLNTYIHGRTPEMYSQELVDALNDAIDNTEIAIAEVQGVGAEMAAYKDAERAYADAQEAYKAIMDSRSQKSADWAEREKEAKKALEEAEEAYDKAKRDLDNARGR